MMRFFVCLIASVACFAATEDHLISTPEAKIHQGVSLEGWKSDFEEAKQLAKRDGKMVLLAFLGPNWCPWSDQLEEEILSKKEFREGLFGELVLAKVEIPDDFEEADYAGKELKTRYQIHQCPALVLTTASGEAIAKLDSLPVDSRDLTKHIKQTLSDYRRLSHLKERDLKQMKVDELQYLYAHAGRLADQTFKKALLKQGLKVDRGPYFLLEEYNELLSSGQVQDQQLKKVRHKILARDPNNELGCQRRLALIDFEALSHQKGQQTVERVVQPLVEYLSHFGAKDPENAWEIELKISKYCYTKNRLEDALRHAQASLKIAPDDVKGDINRSIEFIKARTQ